MDEQINSVLQNLSYGLYVLGANNKDQPAGCIVNTVMQITNVTPIIATSVNLNSHTYDVIRKTGFFSVSVLSEKTDPGVIGKLGFFSGRDKNKFADIDFHWVDGLPVIDSHICCFVTCEVVSMHMSNTHMVVLGRVMEAENVENVPPMTYRYYHEVVKGKAPKGAPTYIKEMPNTTNQERQEEEKMEEKVSYVCTVCGYVHEGDLTKEPDDYVCPICGVGKDMFEKQ